MPFCGSSFSASEFSHSSMSETCRTLTYRRNKYVYEAGGTGGLPLSEISLVTRIFWLTVMLIPATPQL